MKVLSRHLPLITNRIAFQLDDASKTLPLITPRIDFSDVLVTSLHGADETTSAIDDAASSEDSRGTDKLSSAASVDEMFHYQSNSGYSNPYPSTSRKIPKPTGEPGRPHSGGYSLEEELGAWEADMQASINNFIKKKAKEILDVTASYSKQDSSKIAEICSLASKIYPVLDKYENHWPVRDFLKLHLKYTSETHRKQEATRRGKRG